jgi:hypothetical protein
MVALEIISVRETELENVKSKIKKAFPKINFIWNYCDTFETLEVFMSGNYADIENESIMVEFENWVNDNFYF